MDFNKQRVEWHKSQRQKQLQSASKGVAQKKIVQLPAVNGNGINGSRTVPALQVRNSFIRKVGAKAVSTTSPRNNRFGHILPKLKQFNGKNGRDYVEDFCRMGKYGKPKVTAKFCALNGWKCVIEIGKAGLKVTESSKQKRAAVSKCYHKLAVDIRSGNV